MKIYNIFHSHLLRKDFNDPLFEQIQKFSNLIIIKKRKKYKLNNIENFR